MEHYQDFRQSNGLRDSSSGGYLTIQRRQASPRTRRAGPSRIHVGAPSYRYRIFGYRMATVFVVFFGMSVLMPIALADIPDDIVLEADGISLPPLEPISTDRLSRDPVLDLTGLKCPEWAEHVIKAGFKVKDLKTVDALIWRESRCRRLAHNTTLNRDGSQDYGLMQINDRSWCKRTRYYADGYLQGLGILHTCEDLFIASTNLRAAFALYKYSGNFDQWLP